MIVLSHLDKCEMIEDFFEEVKKLGRSSIPNITNYWCKCNISTIEDIEKAYVESYRKKIRPAINKMGLSPLRQKYLRLMPEYNEEAVKTSITLNKYNNQNKS